MDDDDRTTREGLFNTAEAYRLSAMALEQHPVDIGHAAKPVQFLYSHAIELFLKALLRQKHGVAAIRDKFRHDIAKLVAEAETLGLVVPCEDRDVFGVMENTDVLLQMRYIKTGPKTLLETVELEKLRCATLSIRDRVIDVLLLKGDLRAHRRAVLRCGVGCIGLLSADRSRGGPLKMPPRVREGECHPRWQLSGWVTEVP
jgi:hypothetical protein